MRACSVLGARCSVLGARCSVLGARCSVLGARCSVLGARCSVDRVIGNCMCFSDHRAFIQLRDRLDDEAYDLGSNFADAEKHVFVRDRHSTEKTRCYNMSTLTL